MSAMNLPLPNIVPLIPEMFVAVMGMVVLILDLFLAKDRKVLGGYIAIATCLVAGVMSFTMAPDKPVLAFYGFFVLDPFAAYAKLLIYAGTALAVVLSLDYIKDESGVGEYYSLMLFSMLGMMIMASATNFVTMYLGLELMALCTYVLVGFQRDVLRSSEAGLKYFVLGSLASGILLYGVSFLYGVTGSFQFTLIGAGITQAGSGAHLAMMLGLVFVIAGMAFKISLAPFHMWTPDAYEGAPTPITAFMSVAPKVPASINNSARGRLSGPKGKR